MQRPKGLLRPSNHKPYAHGATVSSQVYFCSSPIRIDPYNRCQFSCEYCFSRSRSRQHVPPGLQTLNASAFRSRLQRVSEGTIRSAFDEFLQERVPIQLGGLHDPFSKFEGQLQNSLSVLRVLHQFEYPTLISTKGGLVASSPYIDFLEEVPSLVRISMAGSSESLRRKVDKGSSPLKTVLGRIDTLSSRGIPVSVRLQPILPGQERSILRIIPRLADAGAKHVAFEHLKLPLDPKAPERLAMTSLLGEKLTRLYQPENTYRVGRDLALKPHLKIELLRNAKEACHENGMLFGAGDTEFIPESDGNGCCNGSSLLIDRASQFTGNLTGLISSARMGQEIRFSDIYQHWTPREDIHNYLTTNSRTRTRRKNATSWLGLLEHRWNGKVSPYSPAFFMGVQWSGRQDSRGRNIYLRGNGLDTPSAV